MIFRIVAALSLGLLGACSGDDPTEEDTDTTEEEEETEETGTEEDDFTGKEGSIVLVHFPELYDSEEYSEGFAVFLDDTQGVVNLAYCWAFATCVSTYPPIGTPAEGEDGTFLFAADSYQVDPLLVGSAPNELNLFNYVTDFDWYWSAITGWGGDGIVSLDGEYAPYTGTNDFPYPTPMVVTAPDPAAALSVGPDDIVTLTWEPATDGMVLLEWGTMVTVLEDDGSHDLVVADLQPDLSEPISQHLIRLSRVIDTEVDAAGNNLHVQTRSQQVLAIGVVDDAIELVLGVDVADKCEDAASLPSVVPGLYWGNMSIAEDDEDPGDLTGFVADGNDVVARIDLLAGQTLDIEYMNFEDGSVYLLTDSCDPDDGLEGEDSEYYDEPEDIDFEADADGPVYLVLDSFFPGGSFYWVDIEIDDPAL